MYFDRQKYYLTFIGIGLAAALAAVLLMTEFLRERIAQGIAFGLPNLIATIIAARLFRGSIEKRILAGFGRFTLLKSIIIAISAILLSCCVYLVGSFLLNGKPSDLTSHPLELLKGIAAFGLYWLYFGGIPGLVLSGILWRIDFRTR